MSKAENNKTHLREAQLSGGNITSNVGFGLYKNPPQELWPMIMARPAGNTADLHETVRGIMDTVRKRGDAALIEYARTFDRVELSDVVVPRAELEQAASQIDPKLKAAIDQSAKNITTFHRAQKLQEKPVETMPGVTCFRQARPIEKVGLYIPGGTAPLFSTVLMLAVPAQIAGCKEIVLTTPPHNLQHPAASEQQSEGSASQSAGDTPPRSTQELPIHPAVAYAALISGVTKVILSGGAQAIASLAYGTESVPKVYKIFGPGNRYVTAAKLLASAQGTAIDMPAGPSEVMVVADKGADYRVVAQDLLSQAEHGADSQSILLTSSLELGQEVWQYMHSLDHGERGPMIESSLQHSAIVVFPEGEQGQTAMVEFMNQYAPEHLILSVKDATSWISQVQNAGSVFLGYYTPESVGDYASGTNHTLPTNGWAKMYSGVNLSAYTKEITFQELTREGLEELGDTVEIMAEAEGLGYHKAAVAIRRKLY